jgi:uncharacterized membrane protein YgcG
MQLSTPHGDHLPAALDALTGLLSRAEVSRSGILTAKGHDSDDNDMPPTLTWLAEELPDLFAHEVLSRIDAKTRGVLATTCKTFKAAVLSSGLPRLLRGSLRPNRAHEGGGGGGGFAGGTVYSFGGSYDRGPIRFGKGGAKRHR